MSEKKMFKKKSFLVRFLVLQRQELCADKNFYAKDLTFTQFFCVKTQILKSKMTYSTTFYRKNIKTSKNM